MQEIVCPDVLYEAVVEVEERVVPRQDVSQVEAVNNKWDVKKGTTGEELLITTELNEAKLRQDLKIILNMGIKSLAVVLLHSYM